MRFHHPTRSSLPLIGRGALAAAFGLAAGCSAVVSDVGGVQFSPEACVQGGNTEVRRDARLVFVDMTSHATSPTFVALVGGATNPAEGDRQILRARAAFRPSFAAGSYDIVGLASLDPDRCATAVESPLTMDVTIPAFVPPDSANGGPFVLDFWSEANGSPGRQFPGDHSWVRPMCDDGNVFFVHNTGFDRPVAAESNGVALVARIDPEGVRNATNVAVQELLARLPAVLQVTRQGTTVAYLRAIAACDPGPYVFEGVIDAGSEHAFDLYWDSQRNGRYDSACDPHCSGNIVARSGVMCDVGGPAPIPCMEISIGGRLNTVNLMSCSVPSRLQACVDG